MKKVNALMIQMEKLRPEGVRIFFNISWSQVQ
jgi:hypothetical protein